MSNNKPKKRKREATRYELTETSKPSAIFKPLKGRSYTLSVAFPGSIIANAQSHDLKTSLVGQVARALAVFCVDEVVVFNDGYGLSETKQNRFTDDGYTGHADPDHFMSHLLSFLETPSYLRKVLFPLHPNLRTAGTLPSLDMPHHLRSNEWCQYREGVSVAGPNTASSNENFADSKERRRKKSVNTKKTRRDESTETTRYVEVGLTKLVILEMPVPIQTRVTIKLPPNGSTDLGEESFVRGEVVAPSAPREEAGYYWGFNVRTARSLSAVLTECTFDGGYDYTIGTSERGKPFSEIEASEDFRRIARQFQHILIVFGGVAGLEVAVTADNELKDIGVLTPERLFDEWINICQHQGSRTIRTEEAIWLGLASLSKHILGR